jgi:hypothetical protein
VIEFSNQTTKRVVSGVDVGFVFIFCVEEVMDAIQEPADGDARKEVQS